MTSKLIQLRAKIDKEETSSEQVSAQERSVQFRDQGQIRFTVNSSEQNSEQLRMPKLEQYRTEKRMDQSLKEVISLEQIRTDENKSREHQSAQRSELVRHSADRSRTTQTTQSCTKKKKTAQSCMKQIRAEQSCTKKIRVEQSSTKQVRARTA
ncbi:hypothetical protein F511_35069 [Dorcoceras hygrometricum]|uniref:Uncharacterized protein n=1 Tax=Dorcoceras hygrometricum TaxID=472368 RepID=A0A2Z7DDM3_9LAMI|nr:hypothetical protein F511_35069 [Dorcoceras hygrometricum]